MWGIFETTTNEDIDALFSVGFTAASLVDVLNIKYSKKGYTTLKVGIGISYGLSLLIKSGYKSSGINEVVWLGKLVGEAAQLCSYGNRTDNDRRIMVSKIFYSYLNDYNRGLLGYHNIRDCFHGDVVNTFMNMWVNQNR